MVALLTGTQVTTDNGLVTPYGIILPPGSQIAAYVRSTGVQSQDTAFIATNLVPTLAQGLARCRPGLGDFVICLPGHAETVADATTFSGSLVAGAKIVGVGRGGNTPTFSFSAAASQWAVNKADVSISGIRLLNSTAVSVTLAIAVSAADFGFYGNEVVYGSAISSILTLMQLAAGADRADITGNVFRCVQAGTPTVVAVSGIVDNARICDNEIIGTAPSATGHINVTAAATGLKILRNVMNNTTAASVACLAWSNVAATGHCAYNTMTVLSTGGVSAGVTGITVGGASNLTGYFQNFCVNDPNKSGLLVPAVDT